MIYTGEGKTIDAALLKAQNKAIADEGEYDQDLKYKIETISGHYRGIDGNQKIIVSIKILEK